MVNEHEKGKSFFINFLNSGGIPMYNKVKVL